MTTLTLSTPRPSTIERRRSKLRRKRERYEASAYWLYRRLRSRRPAPDLAALWRRHDELMQSIRRIDAKLAAL